MLSSNCIVLLTFVVTFNVVLCHYYIVVIKESARESVQRKVQSVDDFLNYYRADSLAESSFPLITGVNMHRAESESLPWHVTLAFAGEEFNIHGSRVRNASRRFVYQIYADRHVSHSATNSM